MSARLPCGDMELTPHDPDILTLSFMAKPRCEPLTRSSTWLLSSAEAITDPVTFKDNTLTPTTFIQATLRTRASSANR